MASKKKPAKHLRKSKALSDVKPLSHQAYMTIKGTKQG